MFLSLDERALSWFTSEFEISTPFSIRLFPQYAGFGKKNKGYSLAFSVESPSNAGYTLEQNGVTFYVEASDVWFFENTKTLLSFDETSNELLVNYQENFEILN